jgi:hypothetical protein
VKTKTHFAFRVDVWDDIVDNILDHVAGVDDFETAVATYRAACLRWPKAKITAPAGRASGGEKLAEWEIKARGYHPRLRG